MKTLKNILSRMGYITKSELAELNSSPGFLHLKVVIKWGGLPREQLFIRQAINRIEEVEAANIDYCREVFFSAQDCHWLREAISNAETSGIAK
jgi:hypothetical protein